MDIAKSINSNNPFWLKGKKNTITNGRLMRALGNHAKTNHERVHVSRRDISWVAHISWLKTPIIESNIEIFRRILLENFEQWKEIVFHKPYGQVDKRISEKEEINKYIDLHVII